MYDNDDKWVYQCPEFFGQQRTLKQIKMDICDFLKECLTINKADSSIKSTDYEITKISITIKKVKE
jgi:hypothetical protein